MNLGQFETAVRTRLGVPANDGMFDDTVLDALINAAIRHIESIHDWRWLETTETINTSNGDRTYAVAADYRRTVSLATSDGEEVKRRPIEEVDLWVSASSAEPKLYAVYGSEIILAPVPSGAVALTHRYIKTETELSGDSDAPTLPAVWHQAVVEYASYLGFRRVGDLDEANGALGAADSWFKKMLVEAGAYSPSEGGGHVPIPEQRP